jgi:hypothetical protein
MMNPEQHRAASAAIASLLADATRYLDKSSNNLSDANFIANMAAAAVVSAMANAMIAMRDAK